MMWIVLVAALFVAVDSAADTQCPVLPCPFVGFCKQTVPTYYDHKGVKCRGCDQCAMEPQDLPKLSTGISQVLHMCPMVMCMNPGHCDVPYTYSHFISGGMNCTGCPTCPTGNHPDGSIILKKRDVVNLSHFNMCPMVMCMAPGPCDVPLKTSTMHFGGMECAGCAFCPTTTTTA